MPIGPTQVDPAVLRVLLRRLTELEDEAHGVTDTVLSHVPYAGPGIPDTTIAEVSTALVDAFSTLGDSIGQTRHLLRDVDEPRVEIDLRVARFAPLDQVAR